MAASVSGVARAQEPWLLQVEGAGALALGQPQRSRFGPGIMSAVAGLSSFGPTVAAGLRLRAGVLLGGSAADDPAVTDPGAGGLGSLLLAVRLRPLASVTDPSRAAGPWLEVGGGPALTGRLVRASGEVGLGYAFKTGSLAVGPSLRYLHVVQPDNALGPADAKIALLGIEVTFFDPVPRPPEPEPAPRAPALPPPPPPPPPVDSDGDGLLDPEDQCPTNAEDKDNFEDADGCPELDNDRDLIADTADKCPNEAEVVNGVDDQDGCPDVGLIQLVDDRVVLEEQVLFDTERARVKSGARRVLEAVVRLWKQHPEWKRMEIEGHSDARGKPAFNQRLSEERSKRVQQALVNLGFPADRLTAKGFGSSKPRDQGTTDEALQRNRRVELVVIRDQKADGVAPAAGTPTPTDNTLPTSPPPPVKPQLQPAP